jgi:hypothetical protein
MRQHSERWRSLRHLFHHGDLHRLADPMTNRWAAWMCVSPARDEALVTCVRMLTEANTARLPLRLRGLDPARTYRVQVETLREIPSGGGAAHHAPVHAVFTASGSALMGIGLRVDSPGDFIASTWHLTAV